MNIYTHLHTRTHICIYIHTYRTHYTCKYHTGYTMNVPNIQHKPCPYRSCQTHTHTHTSTQTHAHTSVHTRAHTHTHTRAAHARMQTHIYLVLVCFITSQNLELILESVGQLAPLAKKIKSQHNGHFVS